MGMSNILSIFKYQPKQMNESKQDWIVFENKFGKDNMELFKKLQPRMTDNLKKSISYWFKKSRDELETYLFDLQSKPTRKEKEDSAKEGATLIYSDDTWVVYDIKTFEASTYYGKNTRWCICGTKVYDNGKSGKDYFYEYTQEMGLKIYFFIKRRSQEKYAVVKDDRCHSYEVFDAQDKTVENTFLPEIKELKGYENVLTEVLADNDKFNVSRVKNTMRRGLVVVDCKFDQNKGFGYNRNWGGFMSPNGPSEYLDEEIIRERGEDFNELMNLLHEKGIIK